MVIFSTIWSSTPQTKIRRKPTKRSFLIKVRETKILPLLPFKIRQNKIILLTLPSFELLVWLLQEFSEPGYACVQSALLFSLSLWLCFLYCILSQTTAWWTHRGCLWDASWWCVGSNGKRESEAVSAMNLTHEELNADDSGGERTFHCLSSFTMLIHSARVGLMAFYNIWI